MGNGPRGLTRSIAGRLVRRIGHVPGAPSVEDLTSLHRAFLHSVAYENLEIQLGRPTTIDPVESAQRILRGRGGYCFHLNGTFASLLAGLGYDVKLARGKVTGDDDSNLGNHMVVLVQLDGQTWLPDVALGDGYLDPLPLRDGTYEQPPFTYGLEHLGGSWWRFHYDERSTLDSLDYDITPVPISVFEPKHESLSRSPDSPFVRKAVLQQRRADHTLTLRGCVLTRADDAGRHVGDVADAGDWWSVVTDEFGLDLDGIAEDERTALWRRIRSAHEEWDAAGRP